MREIKTNCKYRHFKGKEYEVLHIGIHSETRAKMVIYRALYDGYEIFVRPYDMFASYVDKEKYPLVKVKYRFEEIK